MPSNLDPNPVVAPGPGVLPGGTVPANALIFVQPTGGGSGVTFGADLLGSTALNQWVGSISGLGGGGGTVPLNVSHLSYAAGISSPSFTQAVSVAGPGQNLVISAQGAGPGNNNGGNAELVGGAATGSGIAGSALLQDATAASQVLATHIGAVLNASPSVLQVLTSGVIGMTATTIDMNTALLTFDSAASNPVFTQAASLNSGGILGIRAQNAGGSNHNGGSVQIFGGTATGSGFAGPVIIESGDGNSQFQVASTGITLFSSTVIDLDSSLVQFDSSVSSPVFTWGASAGAGGLLSILGQAAGGSNQHGGSVLVQGGLPTGSGTVGSAGIANSSGTAIIAAGALINGADISITATGVLVASTLVTFSNTISSPVITHVTPSGSAPGTDMTVQAQASGGGNHNGGNLVLVGGVSTGSGFGGNVVLNGTSVGGGSGGGVVINGGDASLGGGNNVIAMGVGGTVVAPVLGTFLFTPFDEGGLLAYSPGDPGNSGTLPGTLGVSASTNVTTTSNQTLFIPVGATIEFNSQLGVVYTVNAVGPTTLTLSVAYSGTPNGATTAFLVGSVAGCFGVVGGSASVSTSFTQVGIIGVGSTVSFGTQSGVNYQVQSLTSSVITLATPYTGSNSTGTGTTLTTHSSVLEVVSPPGTGTKLMQQGVVFRVTAYGRTLTTSSTQIWTGSLPYSPLPGGTIYMRATAICVDTTAVGASGNGGAMSITNGFYTDSGGNLHPLTYNPGFFVTANSSTNTNTPAEVVLDSWGFSSGGKGISFVSTGSPTRYGVNVVANSSAATDWMIFVEVFQC